MLLIGLSQYKSPVPLTLRRCLIDSDYVATLFYATGFPNPKRPSNLEMKTGLRKVLAWSESENVYRRKANYLASWAPKRPVNPADITAVADWIKLWKIPDAKSIEGDLHFHPRTDVSKAATPPRLERIDNPTGPAPRSVGIPAVGP